MKFTKLEVKWCASSNGNTLVQYIAFDGDRLGGLEVGLHDYAIKFPTFKLELELVGMFERADLMSKKEVDKFLSTLGNLILSIKNDDITGIISTPGEIEALAEFYSDFCSDEGELDVQFLMEHTISQAMFDRLQRHT